uniref:Twin-arginine translocase subunit TatC n=1 Tax=Brugia timori TaxID=42155 RepID=A0A0R3QH45_9BILA
LGVLIPTYISTEVIIIIAIITAKSLKICRTRDGK